MDAGEASIKRIPSIGTQGAQEVAAVFDITVKIQKDTAEGKNANLLLILLREYFDLMK
jgi:hypothetical protein